MTITQPLDLEKIFVVNLAGSQEIFTFVAMLMVGMACAYFKFSNRNAMILFALFTVMMATYLQGLYVIVILLAGMSTFYTLARLIK